MAFNRGCAETAGLYAFGCQQQTPTPLPDIPATAVLFGFGPDGLLPEGSGGDVGSALDALNQYLSCFPQNICGSAEEGDIIYHNGTGLELVSLDDLLGGFIDELLPQPGQFLFNDGGNVGASDLCDEVYSCLSDVIGQDGNILTNDGGNLVSTSFDDILQDALDGLLDPGEVLINDSGNITGAVLCDEVFDCLSSNLGSGQIPLGGAPGGVGVLCDEVENCLGNLLGNGEVLMGGTSAPVPVDLCAAVADCFDSQFNTSSGDILYDAGSGLVPTDLCTVVLDCLVNGNLFSSTNTYLGTDASGAVGEIDFCQSVSDCLASQAAAGSGNGSYYGVDDSGNLGFFDLCTAVADCVAALPAGTAGQLSITNAAGDQEWRDFIAYLNEFYPQTACDTYLYFDTFAGTWTFRTGVEPLPPNPAVDLLPIIPPANAKGVWEFDKETGCSDLVCSPRQKDLVINVPGDFPTVQDAVNWLRAKTIEAVTINLTAADPGFNADQVNGRLTINANGNTVAGISQTSTTVDLTVNDAVVTGSAADGIFVALGSVFRGNNLTIDGNAGIGVQATDSAQVNLSNVSSISNNGVFGILAAANSSITTTGVVNVSNNGSHGAVVDRGSILTLQNASTFQSNGGSGLLVSSNSTVAALASLTVDGSGEYGGLISQSVLKVTNAAFNNSQNGFPGLYLEESKLLNGGSIAANLNTGSGFVLRASTIIPSAGVIGNDFLNAESNGGNGVEMEAGSNIKTWFINTASNASNGAFLISSTLHVEFGLGATDNNANGLVAIRGSQITSDQNTNVINNGANGAVIGQSGLITSGGSAVTTFGNNGGQGLRLIGGNATYFGVGGLTAQDNGGDGIFLANATMSSQNSTIINNGGVGITFGDMSYANLIGSSFFGNAGGPSNQPFNTITATNDFTVL